MMKKAILSLGVLMLLLALVVAPAFAAEAVNEDTGKNSENWAVAAELDFDVVYNGNFAMLHNFTFAGANTGWNLIPGEGKGNSILTGSASAGANTSNFQNTNVSVIEGEDGDEALAKNKETGKGSENWAIAADVDAAVVWNSNMALLCNFTYAGANSGFNHIGGKPLCGTATPDCEEGGKKNIITTGAASATANTTNVQNTNLSMISVGGQGGAITAENKQTGKNSENIAVAANIDAAVVVNLNAAFARNATIAMANTGFNGISGDKKNEIHTGAASAGANTSNFQNTNVSVIEQNGSGATTASNKETGKEGGCGEVENSCPDSVAVAVDVEAAVVVNKNLALLDNTTVAAGNSGGNDVSGGDKNVIDTGDASAEANTTNVQNTNVTVIGEGSCLFPDLCEPTCGPSCD